VIRFAVPISRPAAGRVVVPLKLTADGQYTLSGALDLSEPFVVTALQFESVRDTDVAVPLAVLSACSPSISSGSRSGRPRGTTPTQTVRDAFGSIPERESPARWN